MKVKRKMVHIDEDKCDGCGLCVPSCAEGALQIIDGKAKLVSDVYCDGLGACLGDCPKDAISIVEREAEEFDEEAVEKHLSSISKKEEPSKTQRPAFGGCPGMAAKSIQRKDPADEKEAVSGDVSSQLANWPVQITLIPPVAPYLANASLLICADCVPMAYGDFHSRFVKGRVVLMGCPKLDDGESYVAKLSTIFSMNTIKDVVVPYMEVPCCGGLVSIVKRALADCGKDIPVTFVKVGIGGDIQAEDTL
jgi:Pyruvate/2-oxoacid:ferredoxin oxidoreductase delta subunit